MSMKIESIDEKEVNPLIDSPQFSLLLVLWGVSGLILIFPYAESWSIGTKLIILGPAILVSFLVLFANPPEGFALWAVGITLLITQTGFQGQIAGVTTSVLELIVVFLLIILVWYSRRNPDFLETNFNIPGEKLWVFFVVFSISLFIISLLRGIYWQKAIFEFKGFIIYPFIIYLFLAGIKSEKSLRLIVSILLVWYSFVSLRGMFQFSQNTADASYLYRIEGEYAPINLFGITLVVIALLLLGIAISLKPGIQRFLFFWISLWLIVGSITSVARSIIVVLLVGLIALLFSQRSGRVNAIILLIISIFLLFYFFPNPVADRLFQLSDSSTFRRLFYLESGLRTLQKYWAFGTGWGQAYFYNSYIGLYPTGSYPWYHNDFLNLGVQIGVFGLIIYFLFWGTIIFACVRRLRNPQNTRYTPYIRGSFLALVGLLGGAMVEHVLWRPDMAGVVGLILGILIVSLKLDFEELEKYGEEHLIS